jgi:iron complex outermembrane receptor protein
MPVKGISMHKKYLNLPQPTPLALALTAAFAWLPMLAQAQDADTQSLQRVEVTGSSIKHVEGESVVAIQTLRREDIDRAGVTTAAELLSKISANSAGLTDGASFTDLPGQRGFSGANLRGLGVSSTLVLLNGRRLANFASPGGNSGVDLNSIPAAAIARVEVVKDGASAIYGADAIGGVINFITRTDYTGGDLSAYRSSTQHGGAGKDMATIAAGTGNLSTDRYNLMGVLDYQKTGSLKATQRSWIGSAYEPDINLDVSSSNTFPANVRRTTPSGSPTGPRMNPSVPGCNPPSTVYAPDSFVGGQACLYDYMHATEIFPDSQRLSLITRGQLAVDAQNTLFAELLDNRTVTDYRISPATLTNLNYPVNGPFYPSALISSNQTPLRVSMRMEALGPRTNRITANEQRVLLGLKGTLDGWDYDTALNHSVSTVDDKYIDGYVRTSTFNAAFLTGQINPFGDSGTAGDALLASTKVSDDARRSRGTTDSLDFKASRELFDMAGGAAAVALGAELRHEHMGFTPSALLAAGELRGDAATPAFGGGRTVTAAFAEFDLPISKQLEAQLAARYDHYSDFGSSTNPKLGIRWTPAKEVVVRGSVGTGFRAPSMSDLYTPPTVDVTNGVYNDPLGCIKVGAIDNTTNPDYCGLQPDKLSGGNAALKAETSRQFSFGVVFEPSRGLLASLDYWHIAKNNVIDSPEGSYFADPVGNAAYITRGPADPTLPGIPGPILQIDSRLRNVGKLSTSGLDLGLNWPVFANTAGKLAIGLNGTYVFNYRTQDQGGPVISGVGIFVNNQVVQRWRHTLSFDYDLGPWSTTLQNTFYSSYQDQNPNPDGSVRYVQAYSLWDFTVAYKWSAALQIRAGIKNLLDTNPPRSNQIFSFLAGYDPSYTDPRGRSAFLAANYKFK